MQAHAAALAAARARAADERPPESGLMPRHSQPGTALGISSSAQDAALAFESEERWTGAPPSGAPAPEKRSWRGPLTGKALTAAHWKRLAVGAIVLALFAAVWVVTAPAQKGWVSITSEPSGAYVKVDGALSSMTPFGGLLPSGAHQIEVRHGTAVRTQTINVTRGGETVVHLELPPEAAAATGGLHISTEPAQGTVWIDGTSRGEAPVTVQNLAPGPHDVSVKTARDSVSRKVDVQAGTVSSLIISLNTAAGSGWLTVSSPVRVEIFSRDTLLGTTDTPRIMLAAGHYDLIAQQHRARLPIRTARADHGGADVNTCRRHPARRALRQCAAVGRSLARWRADRRDAHRQSVRHGRPS